MKIKIYIGRSIHTMAESMPQAEAFAVCGEMFGAVGTLEEVTSWAGSRAELIELGDKTVVPGFIETHNHLSDEAMNRLKVDCTPQGNNSIADIITRISKKAQETPFEGWIIGQGYNDGHISDHRHLTRADLDKAAPDHPVFIHHVTDHMAYANSLALKRSGLSDSAEIKVQGGEIGRNPDGTLSGLLIEPGAINLVADHIPPMTSSEVAHPLEETIRMFNGLGITSVHDAGLGWSHNPHFLLETYQNLALSGQLNVRVYLSILAEYYRNLKNIGLMSRFGSDKLKLGSVKLFQDGSIQIYTAALHQPYHDRPDISGDLIHSQQELDEIVEEFHSRGMQLAIHCNGDAAISSVLESLEKAQEKHHRPDPRHMLIHCQMAHPSHIERMKAVGALPSYFINHVYYWGEDHRDKYLGPARAAGISPLADTLREGLPFTLHSDMPVTPASPLFAIHCAVNRKTRSGKILGQEQRIDVMTAMKTYTTWAALASFEEDIKGTIEPGKLADFAVLSDDPFTVPSEAIKEIDVSSTYLGGKRIWEKQSAIR